MVITTGGFTETQAEAINAVLDLASPELRGTISAAINSALGSDVGSPYSDIAVLAAIGGALVRYAVS